MEEICVEDLKKNLQNCWVKYGGKYINKKHNLTHFLCQKNPVLGWQHCSYNGCLLFVSSVITDTGIYVLDLAAKLDATADYLCKVKWGEFEFPPPFGREAYPEVSGFGNFRNIGNNHGNRGRTG